MLSLCFLYGDFGAVEGKLNLVLFVVDHLYLRLEVLYGCVLHICGCTRLAISFAAAYWLVFFCLSSSSYCTLSLLFCLFISSYLRFSSSMTMSFCAMTAFKLGRRVLTIRDHSIFFWWTTCYRLSFILFITIDIDNPRQFVLGIINAGWIIKSRILQLFLALLNFIHLYFNLYIFFELLLIVTRHQFEYFGQVFRPVLVWVGSQVLHTLYETFSQHSKHFFGVFDQFAQHFFLSET